MKTGASARHIPLTSEMYNYLIFAWVPCWSEGKGNCCSGESRDYFAVGVVCSLAICFLSAKILDLQFNFRLFLYRYMQSQYESGDQLIRPI